MKHCHQVIAAIVLAALTGAVPAQDYDPERLEAMSKLAFLEGRWTGETWSRSRNSGERTGRVVEIVESKLNGSILTLEGLGASGDPEAPGAKLEHHAFAVIHYDTKSDQYRMHSYKNGEFLDADFSVTGENAVEWGFDVNNGGRMRSTNTVIDRASFSLSLGVRGKASARRCNRGLHQAPRTQSTDAERQALRELRTDAPAALKRLDVE